MPSSVPSDLIREVIREVLQEVIAQEVSAAVGEARGSGESGGEVVHISTQAELDAAVRRLLADAAHPARRAAITSGKVRFVLAGADRTSARGAAPSTAVRGHAHRFERGALTERHVRAAGQADATIIITERVVVTPLAKERARAMGVTITKEG
jgi:hypothetical protein